MSTGTSSCKTRDFYLFGGLGLPPGAQGGGVQIFEGKKHVLTFIQVSLNY